MSRSGRKERNDNMGQVMTDYDLDQLIHSPAEAIQENIAWAKRTYGQPGVSFGVPMVDKVIRPRYAGDVVGIMARPGGGKSTTLLNLARQREAYLRAQGLADEKAVVIVTWDQSTEALWHLLSYDPADGYSADDLAWGRVDPALVEKAGVHKAQRNIFLVGRSAARAGLQTPRMTMETVTRAIERIYARHQKGIDSLFVDFIQCVPVDGARDRQQQVSTAVMQVKELAGQLGVTTFMAVQASRRADQHTPQFPELDDFEWTASGEHFCDVLVSLWYPCRYLALGSSFKLMEQDWTVDANLLFMKLLKQRPFGQGYGLFPLYLDPPALLLADWEQRFALRNQGSAPRPPEDYRDRRYDLRGGGGR